MMVAMLMAAVLAQAAPRQPAPRQPAWPATMCGPAPCPGLPAPPPPPHAWDDKTLEAQWHDAQTQLFRLRGDAGLLRYKAFEALKAQRGIAVGSVAWEAQRQQVLAFVGIERQVSAIRLRLTILANEHRASATAGDIAEMDRVTVGLETSRAKEALHDVLLMRLLIDPTAPIASAAAAQPAR